MDLNTLESLVQLQAEHLALPWEFQGKSGYRLTPQTAPDVARMLQWAQDRQCLVAIDYLDACRMPAPLWLDLCGMKQVRQYPEEDFIIEVETGMSFGELEKGLAKNWQALPLSYPPETLIADVLAEDRPALETGLRGTFRDYVLKTEIATPDGQLTISGADVVKNVTGYDLAKLYVGGRHAFGIVTSVTLKLMALPKARWHWIFPVNSLQAGCALSEKLLNANLPLSVCEIYQSEAGWQVFIEFCGDDWLMADTQTLLEQWTERWGESQNHEPPHRLEATEGLALRAQLQQWSTEVTHMEVALPLSQWTSFAVLTSKQSSLSQMRLQIRPAAGLVYISAPQFPSGALRYLQTEAQALEGFAQILQISPTDAATLSEAEAVLASFNLPDDPNVRRLLNALKKGYDPDRILHTPRLPL
jgi:FAD/FMN-containing dehydrogenase